MFNYIKRLSDFRHTRISLSRPLLSYEKVRLVYSSIIRNNRFQFKRIQSLESPYLDIGCGQSTASGFVNIDYGWWPNVDLCWDIRGGCLLMMDLSRAFLLNTAWNILLWRNAGKS